ncbi:MULTISPECIES: translation elongation factor Ts [Sanguibacter]|jgi:elongation factor Ts|uniref:Elongation factor Ts n=2 Tax=Sanguibacter TaxID=60919 RepID=A0A853EU44_9MICO|nr:MULTISPECIES: translation elongation factor Ts [Sanguibacter]KQU00478.1 elongation factor Ts [Sanguibacter sp. Leaf3]MBF0722067.1 elongation factor Ts [Sanguibacter inulinus]NYS93212.1 elongation factor Ts [Sanguibacter inulinus]WPF81054.1 translation elongation factor Ts [Sanguibacter sp. 4.1]
MANYTAADIKALRERTGAGMLDVKKALDEADGNAEKALEIIRIKGLKGVSKREGNATSEGLVALVVEPTDGGEVGTVVELNSETDFVAKSDAFIALADRVLAAVAASGATDVEAALAADVDGETVAELVASTAATLGEKIVLRRVARVSAPKVTSYLHRTSKDLPPSIGVLVGTDEAGAVVGKDIAQHIAAIAPSFLSREDVPAETVANERRIAEETSRNEGKPEAALPKIIEGRLGGFFKDVVLLDQPLAKDPKKSVAKTLEEVGGTATAFVRFRVGS